MSSAFKAGTEAEFFSKEVWEGFNEMFLPHLIRNPVQETVSM